MDLSTRPSGAGFAARLDGRASPPHRTQTRQAKAKQRQGRGLWDRVGVEPDPPEHVRLRAELSSEIHEQHWIGGRRLVKGIPVFQPHGIV